VIFTSEHLDLRLAAYAVVHDERGLLLTHWGDAGHDAWSLPGGGLETGEHPEQAVVREVEEETGYLVVLDGLLQVHVRVVPAADRFDQVARPLELLSFLYRAHVVDGSLRAEADGSTDDACWFALAEVDRLACAANVEVGRRLAGLLGEA
jgi:8-oxo-dGTP pyrophosphatase MutT (NUDIX family)